MRSRCARSERGAQDGRRDLRDALRDHPPIAAVSARFVEIRIVELRQQSLAEILTLHQLVPEIPILRPVVRFGANLAL